MKCFAFILTLALVLEVSMTMPVDMTTLLSTDATQDSITMNPLASATFTTDTTVSLVDVAKSTANVSEVTSDEPWYFYVIITLLVILSIVLGVPLVGLLVIATYIYVRLALRLREARAHRVLQELMQEMSDYNAAKHGPKPKVIVLKKPAERRISSWAGFRGCIDLKASIFDCHESPL